MASSNRGNASQTFGTGSSNRGKAPQTFDTHRSSPSGQTDTPRQTDLGAPNTTPPLQPRPANTAPMRIEKREDGSEVEIYDRECRVVVDGLLAKDPFVTVCGWDKHGNLPGAGHTVDFTENLEITGPWMPADPRKATHLMVAFSRPKGSEDPFEIVMWDLWDVDRNP